MNKATLLRILLPSSVWAVAHSLLASRQAKELTANIVGERTRDGLYRAAYNGISVVSFGWLLLGLHSLPDREIYRVRQPFYTLMRAGQGVAAIFGVWTVSVYGFWKFSGLRNLFLLATARKPQRTPEAQGPEMGSDGRLDVEGPFKISRHPGNLAPIVIFVLSPRMTEKRLVYTLLTILYGVLGSLHEEHRNARTLGQAYERYRKEVPFMMPLPGLAPKK